MQELSNLLNRAAAAIETPSDLTPDEVKQVAEDCVVAATELAKTDNVLLNDDYVLPDGGWFTVGAISVHITTNPDGVRIVAYVDGHEADDKAILADVGAYTEDATKYLHTVAALQAAQDELSAIADGNPDLVSSTVLNQIAAALEG